MRGFRAVLLSTTFLLPFICAFSSTKTSSSSTLGAELVRLRPGDGSAANDVLCKLLKDDERTSQQTPVILEGLVSKRRAIGKSLIFLDVVPLDLPNVQTHKSKKNTFYDDIESMTPVQAILRRDVWDNVEGNDSRTSSFGVYQKIIQPGVHVKFTGHAGPSRNSNEAILFCHSAKYALANNNPQHLRNVLKYVKEGELDVDEVLDALPSVSHEEFTDMIGLGKEEPERIYSFGELAKEMLSKFPRNYLCNPSQLMGSTNSQKMKLLPPAPLEYIKAPSFRVSQEDSGDDAVTVATILHEQKQANAQPLSSPKTFKQFTVSAWVRNRRRYQGSISVLEVVDDFSSLESLSLETSSGLGDNEGGNDAAVANSGSLSESAKARNSELRALWNERIYGVLHPDALLVTSDSNGAVSTTSIELSETYGNILCSGARVMLQGYLSPGSSEDVPIFWATSCRLLRSSWRPSAVRLVLDLLNDGKFASEEAADALKMSDVQAEDIANGSMTATERSWMSAELTQSLQGENSRVGKITSLMEQSLDAFAYARNKHPLEKISFASETSGVGTSVLQSNETPLRTSREGSFWQRAKKPQLRFMVEQISNVLQSRPEYGLRKLKVVDIGGGKGLLSNLLAETFGDDSVEVQVVDISKSATKNGMMTALRRGLQNIQYSAQDATTLDLDGVDVVVALHACGALSDVALGHAVCHGAGFVICPCCFRSNPHLRVSIPADKGPELVTPEEWLSIEPSMYGELKQLAEIQGDINMASKAMHTICGLRAMAVDRLWHNSRCQGAELDTTIKAFPIGFSTRNLCLVGTFDNK